MATAIVIYQTPIIIIQLKSQSKLILYGDNETSINITKESKYIGRIRHIAARYYYLRELIENDEFVLKWIPGKDNIADIFTKPLSKSRFLKLKRLLRNWNHIVY